MQNPTLLFIPDISGFTDFINQTAIEHSQHIISELLEIIINSNNLDLIISEIEGDAVLFYKKGNIPNATEIIQQSKEMFLHFHAHLHEIEKTNVCQCGACKSVSNLTLKFITHIGDTQEVSINTFNKLIGSDLILAHRLLKNKIASNEYLLLSEAYFNQYASVNEIFEEWITIQSSNEVIDKFGTISIKHIDFNPLLQLVPEVVKKSKSKIYNRKPDISILINAPILLVHNALTDANAKYGYVRGIKKIKTDDKINRVNSSHTCVFDNLEIHFVTKNNTIENNKIVYSEEAQLKKGFKFITDYRLQEMEGITELSIYMSKSKLNDSQFETVFKKIKDYFFLKFIIMNNKKGITSFKDYCERINLESTVEK